MLIKKRSKWKSSSEPRQVFGSKDVLALALEKKCFQSEPEDTPSSQGGDESQEQKGTHLKFDQTKASPPRFLQPR